MLCITLLVKLTYTLTVPKGCDSRWLLYHLWLFIKEAITQYEQSIFILQHWSSVLLFACRCLSVSPYVWLSVIIGRWEQSGQWKEFFNNAKQDKKRKKRKRQMSTSRDEPTAEKTAAQQSAATPWFFLFLQQPVSLILFLSVLSFGSCTTIAHWPREKMICLFSK